MTTEEGTPIPYRADPAARGTYMLKQLIRSGSDRYLLCGVNVPRWIPSPHIRAVRVPGHIDIKANGFGYIAKRADSRGEFSLNVIDHKRLTGTAVMNPIAGPGIYDVR